MQRSRLHLIAYIYSILFYIIFYVPKIELFCARFDVNQLQQILEMSSFQLRFLPIMYLGVPLISGDSLLRAALVL